MRIEQKKIVKIDELAHIVPRKGGATFSQLWQIFFYTRLFKYVHRQQYSRIKTAYNKICTKDNLQTLCEMEYLKSPRADIYCATDKVLPILKAAGFPTELLPPESRGFGDINELNNTDVFIQLPKLEHFYTLLYPSFRYLLPDALLVQLDRENSKYKLTFIEAEAKKPKWSDYIEDKRNKYLHLARGTDFYNYWKDKAPKLDIPVPANVDLKFSVTFVCSIQKDFGKGFNFVKSITI